MATLSPSKASVTLLDDPDIGGGGGGPTPSVMSESTIGRRSASTLQNALKASQKAYTKRIRVRMHRTTCPEFTQRKTDEHKDATTHDERRQQGLHRLNRCGLCENEFTTALPTCVSHKSILEVRMSWTGNSATLLSTALKIPPSKLYKSEPVCRFCAQFFDVYLEPTVDVDVLYPRIIAQKMTFRAASAPIKPPPLENFDAPHPGRPRGAGDSAKSAVMDWSGPSDVDLSPSTSLHRKSSSVALERRTEQHRNEVLSRKQSLKELKQLQAAKVVRVGGPGAQYPTRRDAAAALPGRPSAASWVTVDDCPPDVSGDAKAMESSALQRVGSGTFGGTLKRVVTPKETWYVPRPSWKKPPKEIVRAKTADPVLVLAQHLDRGERKKSDERAHRGSTGIGHQQPSAATISSPQRGGSTPPPDTTTPTPSVVEATATTPRALRPSSVHTIVLLAGTEQHAALPATAALMADAVDSWATQQGHNVVALRGQDVTKSAVKSLLADTEGAWVNVFFIGFALAGGRFGSMDLILGKSRAKMQDLLGDTFQGLVVVDCGAPIIVTPYPGTVITATPKFPMPIGALSAEMIRYFAQVGEWTPHGLRVALRDVVSIASNGFHVAWPHASWARNGRMQLPSFRAADLYHTVKLERNGLVAAAEEGATVALCLFLSTAAAKFLKDDQGAVAQALGAAVDLSNARASFKATSSGPAMVIELAPEHAETLCKAFWRHKISALAGIPVTEVARVRCRELRVAVPSAEDGAAAAEGAVCLEDVFDEFGSSADCVFIDIAPTRTS